jgi:hypothetical protein
MLFFDDNMSNIRAARKMGMTGVLVPKGKNWKGISKETLKEGLKAFGEVEASKGVMMGWLKRAAPSGGTGAGGVGDRGGAEGVQGTSQKRQKNG